LLAAVLMLAVVSLAGGAYLILFGFGPPSRLYRSEAIVRFAVTTPHALRDDTAQAPAAARAQVRDMALLATSVRVVEVAQTDPIWRSVGAQPPADAAAFAERLDAATEGASLVRITFRDANPTVAAAGVTAVVNAFADLVNSQSKQADRSRIGTVAAAANVEQYGIRRMSTRRSAAQLRELVNLTEAGQLKVFLQRTFGLDQARDAYKELDGGHVRGKLVFLMP